jgi:hypothetical protein
MPLTSLKRVCGVVIAFLFFCSRQQSICQTGVSQNYDSKIRTQCYESLKQFMMETTARSAHPKCGFPVISFALEHRDRLNPEERLALQTILTRPVNQKSILSGLVRVHYDTTGTAAPAMLDSLYQEIPGTADQFADSVAAIANYCIAFETQALGYLPIPSDGNAGGGPEHDIYITDLGDYGYTTPDSALLVKPDGGTWTSFTTIDNAFQFVNPAYNKGLPALRVTLAHELHHSIQVGNYGYWQNDIFFYEITSVWMEDVVFPQVKDYLQYTSSPEGHFFNPQTPFNSDDFIMYSRAIWAHFVAKRFGRNAMLQSWQEISVAPPLQAIDLALQKAPYYSNFKNAFAEWTIWNYFTGARSDSVLYYPEGALYPEIISSPVSFVPPSEAVGGALPPLASNYFSISAGAETLPLLVSNVNLDSAQSGYNGSFTYECTLTQEANASIASNLSVPDPSNWYSKILVGGNPINSPFPDPFHANGSNQISFPVGASVPATGTLSIFSSDMKLVYSGRLTSTLSPLIGRQVLQWNGLKSNNETASSGVYIYFIQFPGESIKGKFALVRK